MNSRMVFARLKSLFLLACSQPSLILRAPKFSVRSLSEGPTETIKRLRMIIDNYRLGLPFHLLYQRYCAPTDEGLIAMSNWAFQLPKPILISVLMPVFNPKPQWLMEAIASVKRQAYPHWQLCIADDCSSDLEVRKILEDAMASDERIEVVFRSKNGHISECSNSALDLVKGDWIALLDHDDLLSLDALAWVARTIIEQPNVQLIYSDECKIDEDEELLDPYFKPNWNPALIEGQNLFSHLGVYRADLMRQVGGFRVGLEGSQDYDLLLRCLDIVHRKSIVHIPRLLYFWRIHSESTSSGTSAKPYVLNAAVRAISDYLGRREEKGEVYILPFGYRVKRHVSLPLPPIDILLDARRSHYRDLSRSLKSILSASRASSDFHVKLILSDDQVALHRDIVGWSEENNLKLTAYVFSIDISKAFVFQQTINNSLADLILFWDTFLIAPNSKDWIIELYAQLGLSGVSAAGPRITDFNRKFCSVGMVLSSNDIAIPVRGKSHDHGYYGRSSLRHNVSLLPMFGSIFWRTDLQRVGGLIFDEKVQPHWGVDLCLRIQEADLQLICTPFSCVTSFSAKMSRSHAHEYDYTSLAQSRRIMQIKWAHELSQDKCYNSNLDPEKLFSISTMPRGDKW